jgi:hypothetical protein
LPKWKHSRKFEIDKNFCGLYLEKSTPAIMCDVVCFQPDYYRDAPQFRRVGDGPKYRLEIPRAKLDFTGAYSVIARNCHGEAKAVISLQIYAKGKCALLSRPVADTVCVDSRLCSVASDQVLRNVSAECLPLLLRSREVPG